MHELSLVSSIIDIVEEYRKKYGFKKVNSITLSFGELTCVNENSLRFTFEVLSENTVVYGCNLIFSKDTIKNFLQ